MAIVMPFPRRVSPRNSSARRKPKNVVKPEPLLGNLLQRLVTARPATGRVLRNLVADMLTDVDP